ncbi:synaptophysin-like protein 1 [Vidua macroura]|uniref:synaptophysin-like protein 1 n=1 Tax=Vidua macroura TaxID=187451 RepID=UPI0023A7CEC6|nr:synaptophysin-like protein 1 [Vidua macroura]XP_053825454.1 synaptophysin-like protein 1 [Vidua macroura]XP_053825455.1 synaptophysin-like protein 1 [Vidua macroura]
MAAPRVSLGALKEPLGLNRGLQWFFSIFAFATCGAFEGSVTFRVTCAGLENGSVSAAFAYPFRLNQAVFQPSLTHLCNHTWPRDVHLVGDFSSAARFFVGVAVAAFLYSLGALGGYLGYLHLYRCAGSRLPLADLVASGLVAALWLVASSAWAQGLGHVRAAVAAPLPHCPSPTVDCVHAGVTPMGSLGASVAFGFLNLLLWAGGCWFIYKETPLHRPAPPPDPAPSPM